ncbi:MAG: Glycosyl transferase family 2 [Microgenomates group bacterium GW2011_GWA2_39_19]|nr:MAG: Glycosyl transferase family 2 [Microgenomates group bacterium GW2011_GWA2_39_19]
MKKLPSVSIMIPTFNRKAVLVEALLSLNNIDYPKNLFEVVVVNDGSSDGTEKAVNAIKEKINYDLKYFNEKRKGISHAKNIAINKSRGEVIVSTDDDCLFEKAWLKKLIEPLNDPKIGAVGGPDRAIRNENVLAKSIDFAFSSFIGSGGIHGRFIKIKLGNAYPPGCNMAFKRDVVKKIGLFDETLAPGEDTDFNHRIEKAGYKLDYVSDAFVWHRPRNSIKRFVPYIFKRGRARVEIIRRYPQYRELIYYLPAVMLLTGLFLIILSFLSIIFIKILGVFLLIYFLLLFTAGLSAYQTYKNPVYFFIVPPLILLQHFLHGLGFMKGSWSLFVSKLKNYQVKRS